MCRHSEATTSCRVPVVDPKTDPRRRIPPFLLGDQRRSVASCRQNTAGSVPSVYARTSPAFAPLRALVRQGSVDSSSMGQPYRPLHLRIADLRRLRATKTQRNRVQSRRIEGSSYSLHPTKEPTMATTDKVKNTAQQAKGKLKETIGRASGDDK